MKLDIFNDAEKTEIKKFLENKILMQAVKKAVLYGVYYSGTLKEGEDPDASRNFALALAFDITKPAEQLGLDLRACAEGIRMIEAGFKSLEELKEIKKEEKDTKNPAR